MVIRRAGSQVASMWRLGSAAATVLLSSVAAAGQTGELELPFELIRSQDAIVVEATVRGRPATLLLDTGAATTVIASSLAGPSELPAARFSDEGPGLEAQARWAEVPLALGTRLWPRRRVVVMNLDAVSRHYGRRVDGLLGQDLLREFGKVTIDFRAKRLSLSKE